VTIIRAMGVALLLAAFLGACGSGREYGDPVDGIACDGGGNQAFHAVIHLWLIEGGQKLAPTEGVGSTGSACNYWVRTENEPGVIHIRAPRPVQPSLATFFSIWDRAIPPGQGSGGSEVFRNAAERGEILVNGAAVRGGPAAVPLVDGATIELRGP
jgi:hypothetical protein